MSVEDIHVHTGVPSEPGARFACHLDGPVAVVTMNYRPYNLMNREFTEQLIEALGWDAAPRPLSNNRTPRVRHHRASGPAAWFTFDLATRLRYDILMPRGPVDRRLARCAGHWLMRPRPSQPKFGERCSPSHSAFGLAVEGSASR